MREGSWLRTPARCAPLGFSRLLRATNGVRPGGIGRRPSRGRGPNGALGKPGARAGAAAGPRGRARAREPREQPDPGRGREGGGGRGPGPVGREEAALASPRAPAGAAAQPGLRRLPPPDVLRPRAAVAGPLRGRAVPGRRGAGGRAGALGRAGGAGARRLGAHGTAGGRAREARGRGGWQPRALARALHALPHRAGARVPRLLPPHLPRLPAPVTGRHVGPGRAAGPSPGGAWPRRRGPGQPRRGARGVPGLPHVPLPLPGAGAGEAGGGGAAAARRRRLRLEAAPGRDARSLEYRLPSRHSGPLSLEPRCVSWRQNIIGSCSVIHLATLCLFIGEFNPWLPMYLKSLRWALIVMALLLAVSAVAIVALASRAGARCRPCPQGWMWSEEHCYYLSADTQAWEASQAFCAAHHATLPLLSHTQSSGGGRGRAGSQVRGPGERQTCGFGLHLSKTLGLCQGDRVMWVPLS
ncbi:killer cell lectin-like receptor subfamily G member 2 isoform X2 [Equus przewalskii]|uniref:Killer cell lectin-like receptor subfamily G member 2 isoform X2 n=1 Tax=Equus przewalskii TaxID=9798 RepID=A0ABM4P9Y4_EQUPR